MKLAYPIGGNSPDFEVVWSHEDLVQALSHVPYVPFVKVLGLIRCWARACIECSINEIVQTPHLFFFGQDRDVILKRVGNPESLIPDVGNTLVLVPVAWFR